MKTIPPIPFDAEVFQEKLSHAKTADDLLGRNGVLTELFKDTLQAMMEAEATNHLGYPKGMREMKRGVNKRNGTSEKTIRSSFRDTTIDIPRDREGTFEPQVVKKYQKNTSELEDKIISMYAKGMTVSDLNDHLGDLYVKYPKR